MQWERDEIAEVHTVKFRNFKAARKHYESNRSTRYYFRLPGCKYDCIKRLQSPEGTILESSSRILNECHRFYSSLYNKPCHPEALNEDLQWQFLCHKPAVMEVEFYESLDKELHKTDLFNALKVMKKDAAPGLDGLTVFVLLAILG